MKLDYLMKKEKPIFSFEIFPPKHGDSLKNIDATLEILCDCRPDFISVTFGAGGSMVNSRTLELARKIKEVHGVEPVVHLTCLNYTRAEISRMLEELKEYGINNILALRGDRNPDYEPKNEFHHASELIEFIRQEQGDAFHICGACYPELHPESADTASEFRNLKKKVDAGTRHLISQLFFDNDNFYRFTENLGIAGIDACVEAGIMPVTNRAQIERMVNICGAVLTPKYRKILDRYGDDREALFDAGMVYAANQIIDLMANGVDGIHLYTMNNPAVAQRICDSVKNFV